MNPCYLPGSFRYVCIFSFALLVYSSGCNSSGKDNQPPALPVSQGTSHAHGFSIQDLDAGYLVRLHGDDQAVDNSSSYFLARSRNMMANLQAELPFIQIPVQRVVLLHAPYASYFDFCGGLDRIVGLAESKFVYNNEIRRAVEAGAVPDVGSGSSVNLEALVALDPDVVLTVGFPDAPNEHLRRIEALGYPVMVFSEWQENTLLGRMEWVKIIGLLLDKEAETTKKFQDIEQKYFELSEAVGARDNSPKVLCNAPYKGVWYVPGGDSYMGNLLRDAGATYIWSNQPGTGALPLSLEQVFRKGRDADVWINPGGADYTDDIVEKDSRLGHFNPYLKMQIYNCDRRVNAAGANDYWESGLVHPHLILADLLHILHPDLTSGHQLVYYRKLNPRIVEP